MTTPFLAALLAARCLTPLPNAPVMAARALSALAQTEGGPAAPPPPPAGADRNRELLLQPDGENRIDLLRAADRADEKANPGPPNPFRQRFRAPASPRIVTIAVGAILCGESNDNSSCILNGRPAGVGDIVEGLEVTEISPDAVVLQSGRYRLRLPLQEAPATLYLPR